MDTVPRVVVVAGGAGNIGEGIVRSALRSGATVVVPSRNPARLEALKRYVADASVDVSALQTVGADVGSFEGARQFVATTIATFGPIDLSVAALGGWWSGPPLLDTSESDYRMVMSNNLDAHYAFARHVVPAMRESRGVHVMIGGPGNLMPNPRSTLITIAGHAQLAMARLLDSEASEVGARTYQLFVSQIFDRQRGAGTPGVTPKSDVVTPDQIGARVLALYRERPVPTVHKLFARPVAGFPL
jgi:NAD(P)-dependent dehydrogenase (short-subunit alcohol dehydrogenase family)